VDIYRLFRTGDTHRGFSTRHIYGQFCTWIYTKTIAQGTHTDCWEQGILKNFAIRDIHKLFVTSYNYQLFAQGIVTKYLAKEILIRV
jgi:hypothetical protein